MNQNNFLTSIERRSSALIPPSPTINAACGLKSLRNLSSPSVRFSALLFISMLAQNLSCAKRNPLHRPAHANKIFQMHEGLTYQIGSDTRFKDSSPCLAVEYRLFKSQRVIHHLQRIVIYLRLRNTGTPPCQTDTSNSFAASYNLRQHKENG